MRINLKIQMKEPFMTTKRNTMCFVGTNLCPYSLFSVGSFFFHSSRVDMERKPSWQHHRWTKKMYFYPLF